MMSLEHKANHHPESSVSGLNHAVRTCSENKKALQKHASAFDSASLGDAFAARLPLPAKLEPHLGKALRHAAVLRIRSLFSQVVHCRQIVVSS